MATQMREYILSVASDLFSTQGINATSVDTIVAKADIAKVTLYKYFKSKEQLILEYLREYDERLWAKLSEITAHQDDAASKLSALVNGMLDWIGDPKFKGFAFINASVEFPQSDNPVHQSSLEFAQTFRRTLAELAREAGLKNADALALQLALVVEGAAITERTQRGTGAVDNAKALVNTLIDTAS
ncbi:MAG: TetR family transcriptional regulator [Betaproteobacteria bacterium HGW-Betaproteobacteria-2]|nr:MAG: TetR family transcriptional regulator [Betaproteobacteria bacterium HGW-Betaproteobacteria-2]